MSELEQNSSQEQESAEPRQATLLECNRLLFAGMKKKRSSRSGVKKTAQSSSEK